MKIIAAVVGTKGDHYYWNEREQELARRVGATLAMHGCVVLTGGMGGVMTEAIRGARDAGGTTIGLLPGSEHGDGLAPADIVLPTGIGILRNALTARMCHFLVGMLGGRGTIEEICFALDFKRPVLLLPGAPVLSNCEDARRIGQRSSTAETVAAFARELEALLATLRGTSRA